MPLVLQLSTTVLDAGYFMRVFGSSLPKKVQPTLLFSLVILECKAARNYTATQLINASAYDGACARLSSVSMLISSGQVTKRVTEINGAFAHTRRNMFSDP